MGQSPPSKANLIACIVLFGGGVVMGATFFFWGLLDDPAAFNDPVVTLTLSLLTLASAGCLALAIRGLIDLEKAHHHHLLLRRKR